MPSTAYEDAPVKVREDIVEAHRAYWEHLRRPGTWWTGPERVAIAAESRQAAHCVLCRERKAARSPSAVTGTHDALGVLSPLVVDTIHRVRTDAGRLTRAWFDGVLAGGLAEPAYVELVAVVTMVAGIDFFAQALGVPPRPLPEPLAGEPTRYRPAAAKPGVAWVSTIAAEDAVGAEADLYGFGGFVPNIIRALSLVPAEVRMLRRLSDAHYLPVAQIPDPSARRALDRLQMELVAARVSALNECFY
jgi:alkylhydroperoxidase family enzyme